MAVKERRESQSYRLEVRIMDSLAFKVNSAAVGDAQKMVKKHCARGHNFGILGGFKTGEQAGETLKVDEEIGEVIGG
jgi:hypothetical protein